MNVDIFYVDSSDVLFFYYLGLCINSSAGEKFSDDMSVVCFYHPVSSLHALLSLSSQGLILLWNMSLIGLCLFME